MLKQVLHASGFRNVPHERRRGDRGPANALTASPAAACLARMHVKRHLSYANGYLELGLLAEAAEELAKIPAPDNESLEAFALRTAVLHEQRDWPALATVAHAFVRRWPEEPSAWITWAYATRRAASLDAAEKILLEAERHHSDDATIQFNLGCYACLRGDLPTARTRVNRAINLDSKFAEAAQTDPDLAALREPEPDAT